MLDGARIGFARMISSSFSFLPSRKAAESNRVQIFKFLLREERKAVRGF